MKSVKQLREELLGDNLYPKEKLEEALKQVQLDAWLDGTNFVLECLNHWHGPDKHDVDEVQFEIRKLRDETTNNFGRV